MAVCNFIRNLLVAQQEERLFWQIDGPVLYNSIYFCQVLRLPPGGSTQQQMEESASFVATVTLRPQEGFLIL